MGKFIDLTGKRFGHLTVIERATWEETKSSGIKWKCICDCGNETIVRGGNLRNGHTSSCGCYRTECLKEHSRTHGLRHTRIYGIWRGILSRTTWNSDKSQNYFGLYRERNIKICEEWKDFQTFYDWAISHGYTDELTIDRINNYGDYCPENCRWVTRKAQARNRTTNVIIEHNGEKHSITEWDELLGWGHVIKSRYSKGKRGEELFSPIIDVKKTVFSIDDFGNLTFYHSIAEATRATGANGSEIRLVCNGYRQHAGGLRWRDATDGEVINEQSKL